MAALAGILHHHTAAAQSLTDITVTPAATAAAAATPNATSGTSSAASTASTISANDFLTLLVTEMKNQDPTASTDPNEYINQLVNVNSLQQLISINTVLTDSLGGSATSASSRASTANSATGANTQSQAATSGSATTLPDAISAAANKLAPGNLGVPAVNPAAQGIAQALSGRTRVP